MLYGNYYCASYCFFRKAVSDNFFQKVLLINFISTYANMFQHLIFARFLLIEGYEKCALRKELVIIAPIVEWFKIATLKVLLMNSICTYRNLLNHFIFLYLLLIEDYEQGALRKELIFAPFVVRFKTATSKRSY